LPRLDFDDLQRCGLCRRLKLRILPAVLPVLVEFETGVTMPPVDFFS